MSIRRLWPLTAPTLARGNLLDCRHPIGNTASMAKPKNQIDLTKYVSVGSAADSAGVSRLWMRELIKAGKVAGIQIDGRWFAEAAAVAGYHRTDTGRPRIERTLPEAAAAAASSLRKRAARLIAEAERLEGDAAGKPARRGRKA